MVWGKSMGTELLQKKANQLNRGYLTWRNANGRQVTELCDGLTLGRDGSNHVVLSDSYVSQRHCRIELRFSRCWFWADLASTVNVVRPIGAIIRMATITKVNFRNSWFIVESLANSLLEINENAESSFSRRHQVMEWFPDEAGLEKKFSMIQVFWNCSSWIWS